MTKIVLNDVTNLNTLSVINDNFDKIETELQNKVFYRNNPTGEPNSLSNDVDANGNSIYNVQDLTIDGAFTVDGQDVGAYIGQAADAAADAAASATAAATSSASALNSASTATAQAGIAIAQASNAGASAIAAASSAASASASAMSASSSASTATTQAGIATTQASIATTQAGIATTKASDSNSSAISSAVSANTATTQAGIATTQAANASSSASSAAASAAAAATALDSFDDRYLGTKASDPSLDNDGNALLTGALYYNTTTQTMKVYDGANWIAATAAGTTAMNVYKYVATTGQTTFSGVATVGGTMSYTSGNILVFSNGVSLDSTDYTATNGTSVVLNIAAALNDEIVVVAFKSFTVADTYTQSAADAKFLRKAGEDGVTVTGGNVGFGTNVPSSILDIQAANTIIKATSTTGTNGVSYRVTNTGGTSYFGRDSNSGGFGAAYSTVVWGTGAYPLLFGTNDIERGRFDINGNFQAGLTATVTTHYFRKSNPAGATLTVENTSNTAGTRCLELGMSTNADATGTFVRCGDFGAYRFQVLGNGNVQNVNNSYGAISDIKLKENIIDASPKLTKLSNVRIVNYNLIGDNTKQIGVIAQELEQVFPSLIEEMPDTDEEGVYLGTTTKSVKYSVFVPILIKAIQEQQVQITALTERVAALEGKY